MQALLLPGPASTALDSGRSARLQLGVAPMACVGRATTIEAIHEWTDDEAMELGVLLLCQVRIFGSNASRKPSPSKLMNSTAIKIAMPGKTDIHHASRI